MLYRAVVAAALAFLLVGCTTPRWEDLTERQAVDEYFAGREVPAFDKLTASEKLQVGAAILSFCEGDEEPYWYWADKLDMHSNLRASEQATSEDRSLMGDQVERLSELCGFTAEWETQPNGDTKLTRK